ncbi:MAG TPA: hypothetical protein DEQ47_12390 [Solibacterales bacterium]|nr:hypothetical protein [Bryobacterales bacterium]
MADPRSVRMHSEDRRRQILDVAVDLFAKKGFAGTTTKEIAAAAGVNEAIIFRHFATKEQLYIAILDAKVCTPEVDSWISHLRDCMERRDDEGLFRALGTKMIEAFREDERFERLMLYALLEGHEIAKIHHQRMGASFFVLLRDYIAQRQREGALREFAPGAVVMAVAGVFRFYAQMSLLCGGSLMPLSDAQIIDTFTGILLNGLRPNGEPARTV